MAICVTDCPRPSLSTIEKYQGSEVATVHEAQGRKGLLAQDMRPIYRPAQIAGPCGYMPSSARRQLDDSCRG